MQRIHFDHQPRRDAQKRVNMARKRKQFNDPNQGSLFDLYVNNIEKLQEENSQINVEVHHARQTHQSAGNSPQSVETGNHNRASSEGLRQPSLFDIRPLGTEQPGRTESLGGGGLPHVQARPTGHHREQDTDQRRGMASEATGGVRLGDIADARDRYRAENYRITAQDNLGHGGAKAKFADNIAAISLLQHLQESGAKVASPEEKQVLVRYVGWGGLPQAFDAHNDKWTKEYQELKELLSPEDYAKARRSTQDAHFTSETVIKGIYEGLERLGLSQDSTPKQVLEPSAGIGNFIGLCPENIRANFVSVELDPTTAAIGNYLYPHAKYSNMGFQNANITKASYDAVVGNPPFGNQPVFDPDFPELRKFSIHNYFLAKSVGVLREGGIGAFVVSRYFLDSKDTRAREHIAQYADFLGAIRLPNTAFKQNALTEVTTDIVFFQKNTGEKLRSQDWVHTAEIACPDIKNGGERTAHINKYLVERPDCIIGTMAFDGSMYRDSISCLVADEAKEGFDLGKEISQRLTILPANTYVPRENKEEELQEKRNEEYIASEYFQSLKMGALCVEPNSHKIIFKTAGDFGQNSYDYVTVKNDAARQRITSMIQIRDTLRSLLNLEKSKNEDSNIEPLRRRLNMQYDAFTRRFGHLNSQTNRSLMRQDPESSLIESLEMEYDKGVSKEMAKKYHKEARNASAKKAAIFNKRVLKPTVTVERADTAKDALLISLRESGKVDFQRMAKLLSSTPEKIQIELQQQELIYLNPEGEVWEIRDKYLTGNVRKKLKLAAFVAQGDSRYQTNVEALQNALPADIEAVDIGIKFGSPWVPGKVFADFMEENIHKGSGDQQIKYIQALGKWDAKVRIWDQALNTNVWGIPEYPASKIAESLLKNTPIRVMKESGQVDDQGKPIMVVDQELTAAAMQKADEMKQAFVDWVWTDDERRTDLARTYNDRFNTHVAPHYDGSLLTLSSASSEIQLRPHQKDVVWRAIQEGTALFDHVVGAGKTMACIATIMENKRMGFASKQVVVVPNHLGGQWRDECYKTYPDAKLLSLPLKSTYNTEIY